MKMLAIEETDDHLKIAVPWLVSYIRTFGITVLPMMGCLLFGAMAASSIGLFASEGEARSVGGFLFSSALALTCIYFTAACWTNRTILDVTNADISVYIKPFPSPWLRKRSLVIADISQLFVQEVQNVGGRVGSQLENSYQLCALLECGERIMLLDISQITGKWSKAKTPASIIEERIEGFLGIEDVPVDKRIVVRGHIHLE